MGKIKYIKYDQEQNSIIYHLSDVISKSTSTFTALRYLGIQVKLTYNFVCIFDSASFKQIKFFFGWHFCPSCGKVTISRR